MCWTSVKTRSVVEPETKTQTREFRGGGGWLESERPEGSIHEAKRPVRVSRSSAFVTAVPRGRQPQSGCEEPPDHRSGGARSQRNHSSDEAGLSFLSQTLSFLSQTQAGGAKGSRKMEGVMTRDTEHPPASVPRAIQAGDAPPHPLWSSANPCVWTARRLTTLIKGVEGNQWFSLHDKVFSERNLFAATQQVVSKKGAAGVDHVTVDEFGSQLPENLWPLADGLKAGTFHPQAIRRRPPKRRCPHPQAGYDGDSSVGHPHGARSRRAGRSCERDRTDL